MRVRCNGLIRMKASSFWDTEAHPVSYRCIPIPLQQEETPMRFYTIQHTFYGGIDLHVDWLDLCVLDAEGEIRVHNNLRPDPNAFLQARPPFREAVVVCVECLVTWDWLADLCEDEGMPFVLGQA